MSSTALETLRAACEETEFLEKAGAACCAERDNHVGQSARKVALWDRRLRSLAKQELRQATKAWELLTDADALLARESGEFSGRRQTASQPGGAAGKLSVPLPPSGVPPPPGSTEPASRDVWRAFYERLRGVEEVHRVSRDGGGLAGIETKNETDFVLEAIEETPNFLCIYEPGEQRGKVLDLTMAFDNYCNWKKYRQHRERAHRVAVISRLKRSIYDRAKKKGELGEDQTVDSIEVNLEDPQVVKKLQFSEIDYVRFLRSAPHEFENIPRYCKYRDADYEKYCNGLLTYLEGYLKRTRPLSDLKKQRRKLKEQFEALWRENKVPGWQTSTIDFGDTYAPATDRLFGTSGACEGHVKGKQYAKALRNYEGQVRDKMRQESLQRDKSYALGEFLVEQYLEKLETTLEATIQHIRKKQSRSLDELRNEAPSDDEEETLQDLKMGPTGGEGAEPGLGGASDDEVSDDETIRRIRNPLNLPLGWDGKPIPYWLYKLHGLGQEFKCEICGNHSYWGRRVFERHFQEWRHAFGMKCLKIPNTLHFKEITKIDDAIALYERLKAQTESKSFLPDREIEVEDSDGNVMTPQTYEDLRRQGLL